MKKGVSKRKLNAKTSHSKSMLLNLYKSLLKHGKIETTLAKAKVLKSFTDEQIGYVFSMKKNKDNNPVIKKIGSEELVKLTNEFVDFIKKQERKNNTGFTTLVRTRYRKGDDSLMAQISLIGYEDYEKAMKGKKSKSKPKKSTKAKSVSSKKVEKKVEKTKEKVEQKSAKPEIEKEKEESVFTKLRGSLLGRKNQGPKTSGQQRARSRSGI